MKINQTNGLVGLKVRFPSKQIVKIDSLLSDKGKNCITYSGTFIEILNNGEEKTCGKCIVKEFAPADFARDTQVIENDNYFSSRILPSQKEEFKKSFHMFFNNMNKISKIISDIIKNYGYDSKESLANYIINIPEKNNCLVNIDENNNLYIGIMLYPFESTDATEKIKKMSLKNRLNSLKMLCQIIDRFHQKNIALIDLKPDNFVYYFDGIYDYIKLFDFDTIKEMNQGFIKGCEKNDLVGTYFFSAPEVVWSPDYTAGLRSDIYSIGAILFYYILIDIFQKLIPDLEDFRPIYLKEIFSSNIFKEYQEKCKGYITDGFWRRFISVVTSSMDEDPMKRLYGKEISALTLEREINTLLEIYEHKGVHPEVMLDKAIELSKDKNFFNEEDFEEDLLCEVDEVN